MLGSSSEFNKTELRILRNALNNYIWHTKDLNYIKHDIMEELLHKVDQVLKRSV